MEEREYIIVSNKHRKDDNLDFWGRYTADSDDRDFYGYYKDFEGCERYTLKEIRDMYYSYPVLDINTPLEQILNTDQFIIKYEDIKKIFKPITVINTKVFKGE